MNQFSLKISDVLNGNRVLAQLLLPKLLSPPPTAPTPDKMIEILYQDAMKEMQVTTSNHISFTSCFFYNKNILGNYCHVQRMET
jgi:hypothetical protein